MSISSYQSMMNNNNNSNNNLTATSTGSSVSNSSSGSTAGAPMSLAAANVVRGIMEKVLSTPPMGASGLPSSTNMRLFNELDYLSSPGLDSDFSDVSPLLCSGSSTSNLNNQYLRLAMNNNKEQQQHGNYLSR